MASLTSLTTKLSLCNISLVKSNSSMMKICLPSQQQSIRYYLKPKKATRKPWWKPVAKSKEFVVREPVEQDPEEHAELKKRYEHYRASVRGIRSFLHKQQAKKVFVTEAKIEENTAADFIWMESEVEKWNQMVAQSRNEKQAKTEQDILNDIKEKRRQLEEKRLSEAIKAEEILEKRKLELQHFITPENLDQEIEKLLDSRTDYNYAVTLQGDVYPGEEGAIPDKTSPQAEEKTTS